MQIRRTTPEILTTMTMTTTVDVTATGARAAGNDAATNTRTSLKTTPQTPENRRTAPEDHRTVAATVQKASGRNASTDRTECHATSARKDRRTTPPVPTRKTTRVVLKIERMTRNLVDVAVRVAVEDVSAVAGGIDSSEEVADKHCPTVFSLILKLHATYYIDGFKNCFHTLIYILLFYFYSL